MDLATTRNDRLRLAQELLDFVLDHLHYDPESLKRCALTSKSLLPTCQRHLFSTYQITKPNVAKLVKLFALPASTDGPGEGATLGARVANLLDTYTTDLILTDHPGVVSGSAVEKAHFPGFKNVQRITFKGEDLGSAVIIPSFLKQTWASHSSKITSVGFDFRTMCEKGVLESLYILPATVEDVSLTCAKTKYTHSAAGAIREGIERNLLPGCSGLEVRQFNGTLKFRLTPETSHGVLLSAMLELGDLFKFRFKRINYRLAYRADIRHLASLVDECKDTLEYLDIMVSSSRRGERRVEAQPFDLSRHHTLRRIRIWTPADFDPDWICATTSSIPKPSSVTPRAPPLRIELHISLPQWMTYPDIRERGTSEKVDELATPWTAVDVQLSRLIGFNPDTLSATSVAGGMVAGVLLDISVPDLTTGPGKGVAALMFPLLSDMKGFVRLV